jgi:hypothetical protein
VEPGSRSSGTRVGEQMAQAGRDRQGTGKKTAGRSSSAQSAHYQTLSMDRKNWMLFGGGLIAILLGFLALRLGDITLSPILLLGGYLVLVPWALVARSRSSRPPADGGDGPKS